MLQTNVGSTRLALISKTCRARKKSTKQTSPNTMKIDPIIILAHADADVGNAPADSSLVTTYAHGRNRRGGGGVSKSGRSVNSNFSRTVSVTSCRALSRPLCACVGRFQHAAMNESTHATLSAQALGGCLRNPRRSANLGDLLCCNCNTKEKGCLSRE